MKKIALLCLALVLALGALGTAYALWYDELFISGTVDTGTLEAAWSLDGYGDSEDPEKDVSHVEAYISGDYLYVYLYDAYPCIDYYVYFNVEGIGSVPFHICPIMCSGIDTFPGTITITDLSCNQVHQGDIVYGTINIHLDNTAAEDSFYYFSCILPVVQYNETCQDYLDLQP